MSDTVVLGIGNILLGDEGVGVHVVKAVQEGFRFTPEPDLLDGGTMGLDLLPVITDHRRVLLVDAVNFGKEPGFVKMLSNDEIPSAILHKFSVHHIGLNDILGVARLVGSVPEEMRLVGIQPESMEPGLELHPAVRAKFGELVGLVIGVLEEWGVTVEPRPGVVCSGAGEIDPVALLRNLTHASPS